MRFLIFVLFLFVRVYGSNQNTIKQTKIENLKNNYAGKTIQFVDSSRSLKVQGKLLDITDTTFIVSIDGSSSVFKHSNINFFYLAPETADYFIASGVSLLSAMASYLSLIIIHPDPDRAMRGVVLSGGLVIGGYIGKSAFTQPIRVDINLNDITDNYAK